MNTTPLHVHFPGALGARLSARLDLSPAPRAFALFAHCFTCSKDTPEVWIPTRLATIPDATAKERPEAQ